MIVRKLSLETIRYMDSYLGHTRTKKIYINIRGYAKSSLVKKL